MYSQHLHNKDTHLFSLNILFVLTESSHIFFCAQSRWVRTLVNTDNKRFAQTRVLPTKVNLPSLALQILMIYVLYIFIVCPKQTGS